MKYSPSKYADLTRVINDASQKRRLSDALEKRAEIGYLGKTKSKKAAEKILKDAIVFIEWSKRRLQ